MLSLGTDEVEEGAAVCVIRGGRVQRPHEVGGKREQELLLQKKLAGSL